MEYYKYQIKWQKKQLTYKENNSFENIKNENIQNLIKRKVLLWVKNLLKVIQIKEKMIKMIKVLYKILGNKHNLQHNLYIKRQ